MKKKQWIFKLWIGFGLVFFILIIIFPVFALITESVKSQTYFHLKAQEVTKPLFLSLVTSLMSVTIGTFISLPLAYLITFKKFSFRKVLIYFVNLPLIVPPSVAGYMLLLTFGRNGLLGFSLFSLGIRLVFNYPAIIIAQIFVILPFIVNSLVSVFEDIPESFIEEAKILGAKDLDIFLKIVLPLSLNGFLTGITMGFARAMGEFGATVMVSGILETLPIAIYNNAMAGKREIANVMSIILIITSVLTLFVVKKMIKPRFD